MIPKKFQLMLKTKFLFTILCLIFWQVGLASEITSMNVPSQGCLDANVSFSVLSSRDQSCPDNFTRSWSVTGPAGGGMEVERESDQSITYAFSIPGTYTVTFTISDDPTCPVGSTATESRMIEILANPTASFVDDVINVCRGSTATINLNIDVNNVEARIVSPTGGTFPVSGVSSVETGQQFTEKTFYLEQVRTIALECGDEELIQDSVKIVIQDVPKGTLDGSNCNDIGTLAVEEHILTGGAGVYTLVSGPGTIEGDRLITDELAQGMEASFVIDAGPACGEFDVVTVPECDCVVNPGTMQTAPLFLCNDGIAMPGYNNDGDLPGAEQLFFILHESEGNTLINNEYVRINRENSTFAFDADQMELNTEYFISVAATVFQDDEPLLEARCFEMSEGVRVVWLPDNDFNVVGDTEICQNATNMVFSGDVRGSLIDGTTPRWLANGNAEVIGENDTRGPKGIFSFENANEGDQISIILETSVKIAAIDEECVERDSLVVTVGSDVALDNSNVIQWPGNILASTADDVCYQWGLFNLFSGRDSILVGENSKFYYAESGFNASLVSNVFWVATFEDPDCSFENAKCKTYNYFNAITPPGLSISDQDDFEFKIVPNPSDGILSVDLTGSFKGNYDVAIINNMGAVVSTERINKEYTRAVSNYDLSHLPSGLYYVILTNELGERNTIKTIIAR